MPAATTTARLEARISTDLHRLLKRAAELQGRTAKYRPEFPAKGFSSLDEARSWAAGFMRWYNEEHRHSGIRYVTPQQRHSGQDKTVLAARHDLYLKAKQRHPARWSGNTRNWSPIGAVTINPERDAVVQLAANDQQTPRNAA